MLRLCFRVVVACLAFVPSLPILLFPFVFLTAISLLYRAMFAAGVRIGATKAELSGFLRDSLQLWTLPFVFWSRFVEEKLN